MSFFTNINVDYLIKIMDLLQYPMVNHYKVLLLHSNNSTESMWHHMTSISIFPIRQNDVDWWLNDVTL